MPEGKIVGRGAISRRRLSRIIARVRICPLLRAGLCKELVMNIQPWMG